MLRLSNTALTFDDVLLVPDYSEILPKDVDLKTQLTNSQFKYSTGFSRDGHRY
jgi:IMP dehydrogenase